MSLKLPGHQIILERMCQYFLSCAWQLKYGLSRNNGTQIFRWLHCNNMHVINLHLYHWEQNPKSETINWNIWKFSRRNLASALLQVLLLLASLVIGCLQRWTQQSFGQTLPFSSSRGEAMILPLASCLASGLVLTNRIWQKLSLMICQPLLQEALHLLLSPPLPPWDLYLWLTPLRLEDPRGKSGLTDSSETITARGLYIQVTSGKTKQQNNHSADLGARIHPTADPQNC